MTALIVFLWIANMLVDTAAAFLQGGGPASIPPGRAASRTGSAWLPGLGCGSASAATCSSFSCGMAFLSQIELSVGVMLGSFNIVVIMLAGRLFFKEKLTRWRVTGISLITLGVAIVGVGG